VPAAANVGRPALAKGKSERFPQLLVLRFEVPKPLGRGLQVPQLMIGA
jgi:hypothetical protein